jgi:hypothetical protein
LNDQPSAAKKPSCGQRFVFSVCSLEDFQTAAHCATRTAIAGKYIELPVLFTLLPDSKKKKQKNGQCSKLEAVGGGLTVFYKFSNFHIHVISVCVGILSD